jgi:hypothetical protein
MKMKIIDFAWRREIIAVGGVDDVNHHPVGNPKRKV